MKKWVVLAVVVIVVTTAILVMRPSVLFRWHDPAAVDPGNGLVVLFNPIRDRTPERVAEKFLGELRAGHCESALAFSTAEYRRDLCDRERAYPARRWSLWDRDKETATQVRLFYGVYRDTSRVPANAWINVRREHNAWRVVDFYPVY